MYAFMKAKRSQKVSKHFLWQIYIFLSRHYLCTTLFYLSSKPVIHDWVPPTPTSAESILLLLLLLPVFGWWGLLLLLPHPPWHWENWWGPVVVIVVVFVHPKKEKTDILGSFSFQKNINRAFCYTRKRLLKSQKNYTFSEGHLWLFDGVIHTSTSIRNLILTQ